jgi:hypothetical protein
MPFVRQHSCMINEDVTNNISSKRVKTKLGEIWVVYGVMGGRERIRSIRFPATIPVNTASSLCRQRGGKFVPATPSNPRAQLLSGSYGFNELSNYAKKTVLRSLIESFDMPGGEEIKLAKWKAASVNDLPDSAFLIILPGGHKDKEGKTVPRSLRLLPYKNASGQIDKNHVRNALARINQAHAPASAKRAALAKLIRLAKALGMDVQERAKFKLSDFEFYLGLLEGLEKLDASSNSK